MSGVPTPGVISNPGIVPLNVGEICRISDVV